MPICIECRHPVKTLWREGAGDKSGGHNIRLTVCKNCGRFCDKYVEHDFVVLFIDLVLIKPQVYRHLLHNTLMRDDDEFAPSIVRLGVLLLLFDVYLTWARIEKQAVPETRAMEAGFGRLSRMGIGWQYLFFRGCFPFPPPPFGCLSRLANAHTFLLTYVFPSEQFFCVRRRLLPSTSPFASSAAALTRPSFCWDGCRVTRARTPSARRCWCRAPPSCFPY